jgi:type I restriction enzyme S subunit
MNSHVVVDSQPDSWGLCQLSEVAKWGSGGTPKSGDVRYYGGEIPWAVIGDLTDSLVSETATTITKEGLENSSAKMVPAGAILIAMYGSIGKLGIAARPLATNQAIAFAISDESRILPRFLFLFLLSQRSQLLASGKGATQQNISQTLLKSWPIPVPPLDEQEKIVEILEEQLSRLDAATAAIAAVRTKAARFRLSLLNSASSIDISGLPDGGEDSRTNWPLVRLGDCLAKLKSGKSAERGWSPQCLKKAVDDGEAWGVLKTTAVQMGEYQPEHNKMLPSSLEPKVGLAVQDGDFLMTTTGPRNRCGVVCHVREMPGNLIFSGKILRFRPNDALLTPGWLLTVLMSPAVQKVLDELKVGTSDSSVSIGNSQVLDLVIPLPTVDDQNEILKSLEGGLASVNVVNQTLDGLEARLSSLHRSLLHSAFSGDLTRDWREAHCG